MKHLAFALALLAASSAHAGSLTLTAVAGGTTFTQSVTISDADVTRVLNAYKTIYGQICDNATPPVCRARTNAETFLAIATGIFAGIKNNVLSQEQAGAASTATAAVAPVTMQ
jgi:hypothetical protein